ncbi:MAG TPA: PKD domain-containing protein [Thermoplasmata archaeon]|nr:PKD domain-containing protein [Thermoplasmata archaeon]
MSARPQLPTATGTTIRHPRFVAPLAVAVAVALVALLLVPSPAPPTGTAPRPESGGPSLGSLELAAAQQSLAERLGPAAPSPRWGAAEVRSPVFAPSGEGYRWFNATGEAPTSLAGFLPMMAWDPVEGYVLLFGGVPPTTVGIMTGTWAYQNGTWSNLTSSTSGHPPPIEFGGLAYDPSSQKIVLFGGWDVAINRPTNVTWTYQAGAWTNITATAGRAPSPRSEVAMATDSAAGEVVLVGGDVPRDPLANDTWAFRDGSWTNLTASAPLRATIEDPTVCDDPAAGGLLLTASASNSTRYSTPLHPATFLFTGGAWENLTSANWAAPLTFGSYAPVIGYLPDAAAVFMFLSVTFEKNENGVFFAQTWAFANGLWTNLTGAASASDQNMQYPAGAADAVDSTLVVFGGFNIYWGFTSNETWILSAPPEVSVAALPNATDVGRPIAFDGSVAFGSDPDRSRWTFGDGSFGIGQTAAHAYASPGDFTAALSVTSFAGLSGEASTSVEVHALPSAIVSANTTQPTAGATVSLAALVSGGTAPFTFSWTLGDGSTATGAEVVHAYASAGNYTVALEVTDAVGVACDSNETIHVVASPSSPPTNPGGSSGSGSGSGAGSGGSGGGSGSNPSPSPVLSPIASPSAGPSLGLAAGIVALAGVGAFLGVFLTLSGRSLYRLARHHARRRSGPGRAREPPSG